MSHTMRQSRRKFLRTVGAVAAGHVLLPRVGLGSPQEKPRAVFAPKIGVCTSVANAAVLRQSGADYIEAGVRRFLLPDKPEDAFASNLKAARECGLPVLSANGFLPGSLKSTGPEANHESVLKFAETTFKRAKRVGIKTIVFGSSGSRTIPEGFDHGKAEQQFIALLKKMGPLAGKHDVAVAVEPLQRRETNFINTVPQGAKIVRAVDHPNIRLLADIFHMLRMDEPPRHIREAGELIVHLHIAEKAERTPPGVAGDDFTGYFQALKDVGYKGLISIECGWKDLSQQLPVALKTLREQMAKVG
ncbi:MAG TPA: sugar phosphate isomerase/epimerase family protein [Phycisphaerae bacterium]|nr:sugar phosphate isomerase/epimerase family protein [Phycisphaerae bacterium]